jgi:hypothetical protein
MTLGVIIQYCNNGLLIAADKRSTQLSTGSFQDDCTKIHPAGKFSVVVSIGTTLSVTPVVGQDFVDFSASELLSAAIKKEGANGDIRPKLERVGRSFKRSCTDFFESESGKNFPIGLPIFKSRVVHYNSLAKIYQMVTFVVDHYQQKADVKYSVSENQSDVTDYFGRPEVLLELQKGSNPALDSWRDNQYVLKILRNELVAQHVTRDDAEKAALYFIWLTSKNLHLLLPNDNTVSETCDIAIIEPKKGFQLLKTNARHNDVAV